MQIIHYIPTSLEDVLSKFNFGIDFGTAKSAKCIAYEAVVSDEIMAIYEVHSDNEYLFYGTYELDYDDGDIDKTTRVFKSWARATEINLLRRTETCFLFELRDPLGIVVGK